jgi:hypothetical protein
MTPSIKAMYEVNIAATPDEFIDWDLPLDEQSESVMNALNKTDWYKYAEEGAYEAAGNRGDNPYGMDLVRWLEEDGAEDAASNAQGCRASRASNTLTHRLGLVRVQKQKTMSCTMTS